MTSLAVCKQNMFFLLTMVSRDQSCQQTGLKGPKDAFYLITKKGNSRIKIWDCKSLAQSFGC